MLSMRSLSFLSKMTIFGFILSIIPVISIGVFSYVTSSEQIQEHVNKGKLQLLVQINANVEQILRTVNHTLNQVVNSSVMKRAWNEQLTVNDFILYDDLRKEIRNMQSFDTRVEDVVLLNQEQDWLIKNSGIYRSDTYPYLEQLQQLSETVEDSSWVLTPSYWFYTEESANNANCDYTVSLVKKLPTTGFEKRGLALANIPTCNLQDMIQFDTDETSLVMLLDEQQRILLHPDRLMIGKPASAAGLASSEELRGNSGQFTTMLSGHMYAVTYYKSEFNGWIYLSTISIDSLTKETHKIGRYTLYVCMALLLVSILLAWIGSRRMYDPIQKLVTQITELLPEQHRKRNNEFQIIGDHVQQLFQSKSQLEQEVSRHLMQVRAFYLIKAYQGHARKRELREQLEQYGFAQQLQQWRTMAVMTLQIDTLEHTHYEQQDMELLLFAIHNIIEEMVDNSKRLVPVLIDTTIITLIGSSDSELDSFNTQLYSMTEQLQQKIMSYLHLQVSIGLSLPFDSIENVAVAYREGLEALKHRLKLGEGIIIQYEQLDSGNHYFHLSYPHQIELELVDAIKLAEAGKAREDLHRFLNSMFKTELAPQEYQIPLMRLLNNLLVVAQESRIHLSPSQQGERTLFEELLRLTTGGEIEEWFWARIIQPMVSIFSNRQNEQYHNISEKIIEWIHQHYDTDLTLEECASRLHYNANYLSSVFRKETNYSFSEYLSAYRFNMAKKWLTETDMPIKDIASRLRYNNSQNFIRSFRKQEGITPGQYRESQNAKLR